jgi:DNA polymerase V
MQVFFHTNQHRPQLPQHAASGTATLSTATNYTPTLIHAAQRVMERLYKPGHAYIKAGVIFSDLTTGSATQLGLFDFDPHELEQHQRLMEAMDTANRRFGRNTVFLAAMGIEGSWKMRQEKKSQSFTTRWDELLRIR